MTNILFYHTPQSKWEVHRRLDWSRNHQREYEEALWWRHLQSGVLREHEEHVLDHDLLFSEQNGCPSQSVWYADATQDYQIGRWH